MNSVCTTGAASHARTPRAPIQENPDGDVGGLSTRRGVLFSKLGATTRQHQQRPVLTWRRCCSIGTSTHYREGTGSSTAPSLFDTIITSDMSVTRCHPVATLSPPPSPSPRSRCIARVGSAPDAHRRPPRIVGFSGRVAEGFADTDDDAKRTRSGSHRSLPMPAVDEEDSSGLTESDQHCDRPVAVAFNPVPIETCASSDHDAKRTRSGSDRRMRVGRSC